MGSDRHVERSLRLPPPPAMSIVPPPHEVRGIGYRAPLLRRRRVWRAPGARGDDDTEPARGELWVRVIQDEEKEKVAGVTHSDWGVPSTGTSTVRSGGVGRLTSTEVSVSRRVTGGWTCGGGGGVDRSCEYGLGASEPTLRESVVVVFESEAGAGAGVGEVAGEGAGARVERE